MKSNFVVFPLDILNLRQSLGTLFVNISNEFVPSFSLTFSRKYLDEYPVLLFLDSKKIDVNYINCGSMNIFQSDDIYIGNAIRYI
jgi:hypothetical protein